MKLTKEQLKQIIKEELEAVMNEGAIYTPNGAYQILDPNNPDDIPFFKSMGIFDMGSSLLLNTAEKVKIAADKAEAERKESGGRQGKPGDKWVYLAFANKNKSHGWEYYDTSNAIDVLDNTYSKGPKAYGQDPETQDHMAKTLARYPAK